MNKRTNIPDGGIRWTVDAVAKEYGKPKTTVHRLLRKLEAGEDGCYSTVQVVSVLFDLLGERVRLTRAQANIEEIKERKLRGELLVREELVAELGAVFIAIRQIIEASGLTKPEKDEILSNIARSPQLIEKVATSQNA